MKRNNKKGFTIVELVIVIAVIAILAGVLIPTFGSIIDKANKNSALQEASHALKIVSAEYAEDGKTMPNAKFLYVEDGKVVYAFEYQDGQIDEEIVEVEYNADGTIKSGLTAIKLATITDEDDTATKTIDADYTVYYRTPTETTPNPLFEGTTATALSKVLFTDAYITIADADAVAEIFESSEDISASIIVIVTND